MHPRMSGFDETFIFGLASSLHCAGMCGPLSACLAGGARGAVAYHVGRTSAYVTVGLGAGGLGLIVGDVVGVGSSVPSAWISIGLALVLIGTVLGMPKLFAGGVGSFPWLGRLFRGVQRMPPIARGVCVGALTPLLPCGVLYVAIAIAMATGGSLQGGITLLGFALGSMPALVLTQANMGLLRRRLTPSQRSLVFRGLMVLASGVLIWRGVADLLGEGCCH